MTDQPSQLPSPEHQPSILEGNTRIGVLLVLGVMCVAAATGSRYPTWGDAGVCIVACEAWLATGAPAVGEGVYCKYSFLQTIQCMPIVLLDQYSYWFTALWVALQGALGAAAVFAIGLQLTGNARRALQLSLVIFFCTPFWVNARFAYAECQQITLLLWTWYALLRAVEGSGTRWYAVYGFLIGLSVLSKSTMIVLALGSLIIFAPKPGERIPWRAMTAYALGAIPTMILFFYYNWVRGDWFYNGYSAEIEDGYGFVTPLFTGLYGQLVSTGKGIVWYCPVLVVAVCCVRRFVDRVGWRLATVLWLPCICLLLIYAKWSSWEGAWGWGPRLLTPAAVVVCLTAVESLVCPRRRKVLWAVAAMGISVNVLGLLVHPMHYHHLVSSSYSRDTVNFSLHASPLVGNVKMLTGQPRSAFGIDDRIGDSMPAFTSTDIDLLFLEPGAWLVSLIVVGAGTFLLVKAFRFSKTPAPTEDQQDEAHSPSA